MQDSTGFTGSYNEPPIETPHLNSKVDHDEASVNAIASWLDQLPPVETMTTAAVVKKLIPSIKKMQAKGYSIDQIAAVVIVSTGGSWSSQLAMALTDASS